MKDNMSVAASAKALSIYYNSLYHWISEYEECRESIFLKHGIEFYSHQYEIKKLNKKITS